MSDSGRSKRTTFGRRILTDNTAIFRLRDIENRLAEEGTPDQGPQGRQAPPAPPALPPALPPSAFDEPTGSVEINLEETQFTVQEELLTAPSMTKPQPGSGGHLLAFFSAKGGVGSTTLSLHVAETLATLGYRVCVVDMDLQMGSAAYCLNMETSRSIANLARSIREGNDAVADFPIAQHESGVYVLDQPDLSEIETLGSEGLPSVLKELKRSFDYVLVDGLRDFGDHALLSMDEADRIVMVITQHVPALRCGIRALELFRRLGYAAGRISLLMNQYSDQDGDFLDAVQSAYGRPINWMIPSIVELPDCANTGQLLRTFAPDSKGNAVIENLTRSMVGLPPVEVPKRGFFAKLFSRGS